MNLVLMIGVGIVGFLLAYLFFKLDDNKHQFLRLLLLGCLFGVFILAGKVGLDSNNVCELVPNYTKTNYQYGNNFTYSNGTATYHWDYAASGVPPTADKGVFLFHVYEYNEYEVICYNMSEANTSVVFYKLNMWIIRIISAYLLVFLIFKVFMWSREYIGGKRGRAKDE